MMSPVRHIKGDNKFKKLKRERIKFSKRIKQFLDKHVNSSLTNHHFIGWYRKSHTNFAEARCLRCNKTIQVSDTNVRGGTATSINCIW